MTKTQRAADLKATNQTVDEILATMTDDQIADMTEAQIEALASQVADTVLA